MPCGVLAQAIKNTYASTLDDTWTNSSYMTNITAEFTSRGFTLPGGIDDVADILALCSLTAQNPESTGELDMVWDDDADRKRTICPDGSLSFTNDYDQYNYRFGFNGKENDNETYGTGNALDFGARIYDSRIGRWLSTDPLQTKYPNVTPYAYTRNSPIARIDVGGYFDIEIDAALAATGKTVLDYPRYTTILKNIKSAVQGQENIINSLMDQTGYSKEKILSDLDFGSGPTIFVTDDPSVSFLKIRTSPESFARGGIYINYTVLDAFEDLDASSPGFNEQVASWTLNLLHEYSHYGDRDNNGGYITGQFDMQGTKKVYEADDPSQAGFKVKKEGVQRMKESYTGHRGDDIEIGLFNVKLSLEDNGTFTVDRKVQEKNPKLKSLFSRTPRSDFDKLGQDMKVK